MHAREAPPAATVVESRQCRFGLLEERPLARSPHQAKGHQLTDRLVFVPPMWISPTGCRVLAGLRAALNDFNARFAVELFNWPTVSGTRRTEPTWQAAAAQLREILDRPSHVVTMGSPAAIVLMALDGLGSVESLICAGMAVPPATLRAMGMSSHTDASAATVSRFRLGRGGTYYILRGSMEGASDAEIDDVARKLDAEIDLAFLGTVTASWEDLDLIREKPAIACPTLYLNPHLPLYEDMDEVFRRIVPACEVDDLEIWSGRLHHAESGHDLTSRAIPFIERHLSERA
jgi:hypothetical protein